MAEAFFLVGDVGGTKTDLAMVSASGDIVHRWRGPTPRGLSAEGWVDWLARVLLHLQERKGDSALPPISPTATEIRGVVLGVPCTVEANGQRIDTCPNLRALDGLDLGQRLTERLGLPVWVQRDVTLTAFGEMAFGAAQGVRDFLLVAVGTGIGVATVLDGRIYTGSLGGASEWGHMVTDPAGPLCPCGRRGCWEKMASGSALQELLQKADMRGQEMQAADFLARVVRGEPNAMGLWEVYRERLVTGLVNLVNGFNPAGIVLAGGVGEALAPVTPQLEQQIRSLARPLAGRGVWLRITALPGRGTLLGGAFYGSQQL